ncbi:cysteine synthase, chloroplastic/chromoplastic isoform X2 [Cryptomeria japonica]|uniref:cysteine synthase, chloroplastic/chromoplastic isoform X2 n=1 Tax=Cryptomeria japonica TaxID=3369 RepID=UPI0027D9E4BF|nr:cysteine synthase, chloroplastic/chromoplastic isoform X2 [Cryptomeria japonica]
MEGISRLISSPGVLRENIASDVTQLIGWTPLVEMKRIAQAEGAVARIVGKLEFYQPLSSVKDRIALRMIEDAEEKGLITPRVTTLVEPTSGNTGIALAFVAAQKGYKFIAVMPNTYSIERRMIMKCLGADIYLTDSALGFPGVLQKVEELRKAIPDVYMLDQISNPANPGAHFQSTGGQKGSHKIQGLAPGFITDNLDMAVIDEIITVSSDKAMTYARKIAREEGLLVGISSGAAYAAALEVGQRPENKGKLIVMMLPSGAERYLSTDLFSSIREECSNMSF